MEKIFDSGVFLKIKSGKYYVFPNHIVFRADDGIYFVRHNRNNNKNPVDNFEKDFEHLGLSWDCITSLPKDDILKIIKKLDAS